MNCQNWETPVPATAERCEKCGAKLLHRRVVFGAPRSEDFTLTPEDETPEFESPAEAEQWKFPEERVSSFTPPAEWLGKNTAPTLRYGGFFRRLFAAIIDLVISLLLSTGMGFMAYIGFKGGVKAHGGPASVSQARSRFLFLT